MQLVALALVFLCSVSVNAKGVCESALNPTDDFGVISNSVATWTPDANAKVRSYSRIRYVLG
jgi:hypothetical protein